MRDYSVTTTILTNDQNGNEKVRLINSYDKEN